MNFSKKVAVGFTKAFFALSFVGFLVGITGGRLGNGVMEAFGVHAGVVFGFSGWLLFLTWKD